MKKIYVIEDLCNGCRLCETFCSSLKDGVFSEEGGRINVVKIPGEEKDIPIVNCNSKCIRPMRIHQPVYRYVLQELFIMLSNQKL